MHGVVLALILIAAFTSFFLSKSFSFEAASGVPIRGLSLPSVGASPVTEPVFVAAPLPDTILREEVGPALASLAENGEAGTASSAAEAPAAVEAEAAAPSFDPYTLYSVQPGDAASMIAAAAGIDLQYLLWANADLRDGELLNVGQLLVVPSANGILHDVRAGETLSVIAERYSVSVEEIMGWPGNAIASADDVFEAQFLFVPNGIIPASILPAEQPEAVEAPVAVAAPPVVVPDPGPVSSIGLSWPAVGPISSYYGASHPLGIDIDLYNYVGMPVGAATEGTVTFSGGDPCCSYGLYVVVMSPTGIETLYAHFSSLVVSQGDYVVPGQTLAYSGCTGYCTGTHVHFEVIDNGVRVDPLAYLP